MARRERRPPSPPKRRAQKGSKAPLEGSTAWRIWPLALATFLALAGLLPLANAVTAGPGLRWYGAAAQEWIVATAIVVAACFGVSALTGKRVDSIAASITRVLVRPSPRVFGVGIALVAAALAMALTWFAFHRQVFAGDEMSQRFQARILASGHLTARAEPLREFFSTTEALDTDGRWFSQFPFGSAMLMAPFLAFRLEWMLNPILLGVACWAVYRFASRTTSETTARFVAVLFVLSPFLVLMGATEMNHVPTLAFIWLGLAALAHWASTSDSRTVTRSAACIGFAFAMAATIRPYDAALIALPAGIAQLWMCRARDAAARVRLRSLAWQFGAGLVPIAALLVVNHLTTGGALLFGYDALNGPGHRPGFHLAPPGFVHSPARGIYQTSAYLLRLDISLFESPVPALLFVIAGLVAPRRATRWDKLMMWVIVVILLGYMAYWHEGYFLTAPRFLYAVAPAFIWFIAQAPGAVAERIGNPTTRRAALLVLPFSLVAAVLMPPDPARLGGVWSRVSAIAESQPKLRMDIPWAVAQAGIHSALVFVSESWHGQLAARLRALGMRPIPANAFAGIVDACALQGALDDEDLLPANGGGERVNRVGQKALAAGAQVPPAPLAGHSPDDALSFVPGRTLTPICQQHLDADSAGTLSFAPFLAEEHFGPDRRLGGDVVFARELHERDELLRPRFGDRAWYRLRLVANGSDYTIHIEPYTR